MKDQVLYIEETLNFSSYIFNYKRGSLTFDNGKEIFMEPRLKEVFYTFLKHKNEFVSKDELMTLAWKDIIVSDQSVTKAVSDLRKFLLKHQLNDLKIITVSKLGYKLEIVEESKKILYSRMFRLGLCILGVIIGLVIIIRALRYEQ